MFHKNHSSNTKEEKTRRQFYLWARGALIAERRTRAGLTQTQLCEQFGITCQAHVCRMETGSPISTVKNMGTMPLDEWFSQSELNQILSQVEAQFFGETPLAARKRVGDKACKGLVRFLAADVLTS
jgi:transcriptional regulator with XRE-family HTH domain